jgi:hypothetical protein
MPPDRGDEECGYMRFKRFTNYTFLRRIGRKWPGRLFERTKQHEEVNLLARFWQTWPGEANPGTAFAALESYLKARPSAR